ncbi:34 kDa antigenic family protein [Streptomyces sp. C1-2]|uniref:34 kDa antigenic family protein n=1 Tax=Streptomyces sp. C1-2 TaxID=2720022 RepID=UPI0014324799|nr:34 kDa antigenic family protein [Streptomyces sp. C1-2]NJP69445.1 34 kDa antigenic family protein [Streptomyces sp. C1-2]
MTEPYGPYGEHGQQRDQERYRQYGQQRYEDRGQGQGQGQGYEGYAAPEGYRPGYESHESHEGYDSHEGYERHEGYEGYAEQPHAFPQAPQPYPHQQHQQPPHAQQQDWYGGDAGDPLQNTQQWQGQTWETSVQPSLAVPAAETAYLPTTGAVPHESAVPHEPAAPAARTPAAAPAPAAGDGAGDAGYGPATVAGNARITDAQRARLEGRSPIIEPGMQPALLTAVLGALLAGTAAVGSYALVVPLVLLQAVTAAGWFRLNGMWPARQGIALAFLGGLVADVAVLAKGREHGPAAILGTLGVWVLLTVVLQLRSHADADERMYGLMATVVSAALTIVATGHLAAEADAVTVGGVAVAVAIVARALPLPTAASVVVALLAAAGAGIAVGGMTDLGSRGAVLGAGAGVCALIGHRAASYDYPSRFVHFTAGVALPLAAAAPAVYVLGRALG